MTPSMSCSSSSSLPMLRSARAILKMTSMPSDRKQSITLQQKRVMMIGFLYPFVLSSYLQDRTNGRLVVKRVRNQELAYKLVWIACKNEQLDRFISDTDFLLVIGSEHRGQGCAPGPGCPADTCTARARPCWA